MNGMTEAQKHAQALLGWLGETAEERTELRRHARAWLKMVATGKLVVAPRVDTVQHQ